MQLLIGLQQSYMWVFSYVDVPTKSMQWEFSCEMFIKKNNNKKHLKALVVAKHVLPPH